MSAFIHCYIVACCGKLPMHKPVVVPLCDSSSEEEDSEKDCALQSVPGNKSDITDFDIDRFLKLQRKTVEVSKDKHLCRDSEIVLRKGVKASKLLNTSVGVQFFVRLKEHVKILLLQNYPDFFVRHSNLRISQLLLCLFVRPT